MFLGSESVCLGRVLNFVNTCWEQLDRALAPPAVDTYVQWRQAHTTFTLEVTGDGGGFRQCAERSSTAAK